MIWTSRFSKSVPRWLSYSRLTSFDGERPLIAQDPDFEKCVYNQPKRAVGRTHVTVLYILLLISVMINMLVCFPGYFGNQVTNFDHSCVRQMTFYDSPILDDITFKYNEVKFDGKLWDENIYRREPSPEVDKAWSDFLGQPGYFTLPTEGAEKYGLSMHKHIRTSPEHGGEFLVGIEGVHHLHCVDLIRQSTWFNYEYYRDRGLGPFNNDESVARAHTTHCLDTLRQQIACHWDPQLMGFLWVADSENKTSAVDFPDFITTHKCRNWDAIHDWVDQNRKFEDFSMHLYDEDKIFAQIP